MSDFYLETALQNGVVINPYEWQTGKGMLPLDFANHIPGPIALGAGLVPFAGGYSKELNESNAMDTNRNPPTIPRESYIAELALAALLVILLVNRNSLPI